jgi:hypothetical protein
MGFDIEVQDGRVYEFDSASRSGIGGRPLTPTQISRLKESVLAIIS